MQEGEAATPQYEYEYVYEYEDVEDASKKVLAPAPVFRDQPPGKAHRSGRPAENWALSSSRIFIWIDNILVSALVLQCTSYTVRCDELKLTSGNLFLCYLIGIFS